MTSENDHLGSPSVAKNVPEQIVQPKTALAQFIEGNSKLVTSIAGRVAHPSSSNLTELFLSPIQHCSEPLSCDAQARGSIAEWGTRKRLNL
jgi:hypothetical protein